MNTKKLLSEKVIEDLQDYISNPYGFILLVGANGTGKSYVAKHVYEHLTPYKLPAYDHDQAWFINQADLNVLFSQSIEVYGSTSGLLKEIYVSKLFIIDDLGTRPPSPAFMDFIYALIDKRWNERMKLGTIITTNLDSNGIRKNFGEAIFSRISSGRIYVVTGNDRRQTELGF